VEPQINVNRGYDMYFTLCRYSSDLESSSGFLIIFGLFLDCMTRSPILTKRAILEIKGESKNFLPEDTWGFFGLSLSIAV
jgi:hypothetical protein